MNTPLFEAGRQIIEIDVAPPGIDTVITGEPRGPTCANELPVICKSVGQFEVRIGVPLFVSILPFSVVFITPDTNVKSNTG